MLSTHPLIDPCSSISQKGALEATAALVCTHAAILSVFLRFKREQPHRCRRPHEATDDFVMVHQDEDEVNNNQQ
jgi:hypothetical protein